MSLHPDELSRFTVIGHSIALANPHGYRCIGSSKMKVVYPLRMEVQDAEKNGKNFTFI
jgi:hypothetical protein